MYVRRRIIFYLRNHRAGIDYNSGKHREQPRMVWSVRIHDVIFTIIYPFTEIPEIANYYGSGIVPMKSLTPMQ